MPSKVELDILHQDVEIPPPVDEVPGARRDGAPEDAAAGEYAPSVSQWYLFKLLFDLRPRYLAYAVAAGFVLLAAFGGVSGWWLFYSREQDLAFEARARQAAERMAAAVQVVNTAQAAKPARPVYTLPMAGFVLPLSDDTRSIILEMDVALETFEEAVRAELRKREVGVRDQIVQTVKAYRIPDLVNFTNRERMSSELTLKINAMLESGEVQRIRFSKFNIRQ